MPLTKAELQLWFFRTSFPMLGYRLAIKHEIDIKLLEETLCYIINQQPSFWQKFNKLIPLKKCYEPNKSFKLQLIDITQDKIDLEEEFKKELKISPFNYDIPLIKAKLFKLSDSHYEFHCLAPHIVCDFYSLIILNKMIFELYEQKEITPLCKLDYDFVENPQNSFKTYKQYQEKLDNTLSEIENFQALETPMITKNIDYCGSPYQLPFNSDFIKVDISHKYNTSDECIFYAAALLSIAKFFNKRTIPFGLIDSGRNSKNFNAIGMFAKQFLSFITIENIKVKEFIDHITQSTNNMEESSDNENTLNLACYQIKCSGFFKLTNALTKTIFWIWNKTPILNRYSNDDIYTISVYTVSLLLLALKKKIGIFSARMGLPVKMDTLIVLNSVNPKKSLDRTTNREVINPEALLKQFRTSAGNLIYFTKHDDGSLYLTILGRNFTSDFREKFIEIFINVLKKFAKDDGSLNINDLLNE
jgi:hypothetical protein